MNGKLRKAGVLAILLAIGACAKNSAELAFEPDPILHPPGGRIVFNRMCADEHPYRVQAYARMESRDGRARVVAAVQAGYRATGGKTVYIDVRIQRLKVNAGKEWQNADYTIRLKGRSARNVVEGPSTKRVNEPVNEVARNACTENVDRRRHIHDGARSATSDSMASVPDLAVSDPTTGEG